MRRNLAKNNNGISLISVILLILFTILVVFLAYGIFLIDVFNIQKVDNINPISSFKNWAQELISSVEKNEIEEKNIEIITPIIDETEFNSIETVNFVKYYYKQLDHAGKTIYDALEEYMDEMKSGSYKIDFETQFNELLNSENGNQKLKQSFQSAWNAFTYDYADIFYIDVTKLILTTQTTSIGSYSKHRVDLSSGDFPNYFEKEISSEKDLRKKEQYIKNVREQFIEQLEGVSEYEQIKLVHDWLVANLEYDTTYNKDNIHNIYGAFSSKFVVCEGYARAFKYVLDGLGIENILVSGIATNTSGETESHAWNYVKLDNKWYAIDVTWDDPVVTGGGELTDKIKYKYFLKGSNDFFKDHEEDGYLSNNSIKFKFPKLEIENYNK